MTNTIHKVLMLLFTAVGLLFVGCEENRRLSGPVVPSRSNKVPVDVVPTDTIFLPTWKGEVSPTERKFSANVPRRVGDASTPSLSEDFGLPLSEVSEGIVRLITRENKALSSLLPGDTVYAWTVNSVEYLFISNGKSAGFTDEMSPTEAEGHSITLSFFPDGFYTLAYNIDSLSSKNTWGWYQMVLDGGFPVGIIYNQYNSGKKFDLPAVNPSKFNLAFGIWGISSRNFYPLFQISPKTDYTILTMRRHNYVAVF